ncbi:MAG: pyridoxal phosphate-dependent aminotransferase [Planctomycetota bacterium]|nr:MAG: pyridoxal phosphate-dependent aminotransferase [Planctomycetota bacterium]
MLQCSRFRRISRIPRMFVSSRIAAMTESATLAVGAKAAAARAKGHDVIAFAMGEPDFDTPSNIKHAAIAALEKGMTKYAPTPGDKLAREAIARKLTEENGIETSFEQVTVTAGAKHAIYMALQAIVEPGRGDEVLLPTPAWVSYKALVELAGAKCVEIAGSVENGFRITPTQLAAAVTPRTIGIVWNSPSNPCGIAYPASEVRALCDVLAKCDRIAVISDEIYEKLIYPEISPGLVHFSPGSVATLRDRTITINGMSKSYAMTGWRIGYMAAPRSMASELIKLQGQMTNSIPSFFYPAIVEALTNSAAGVESMRVKFASRARLMKAELDRVPGFVTVTPNAAFYAFPDVSAHFGKTTPAGVRIASAQGFADALLNEAHVAVVPGEDFGECARGNIRFSFACSDENIVKGIARVRGWVATLA